MYPFGGGWGRTGQAADTRADREREKEKKERREREERENISTKQVELKLLVYTKYGNCSCPSITLKVRMF